MVSVFKAVKSAKGAFRDMNNKLGALVDPWSYKRAEPGEKAELDKGLQALREITAAYKGPSEEAAETAPAAATGEEPTVVDEFYKSQVLKHVEKFIAKAEAYKAGTGSMDMPIGIVTRDLRDLTEEVTNLHNGLGKVVVPLVLSEGLAGKLSEKMSGLTAAVKRHAETLKQKG